MSNKRVERPGINRRQFIVKSAVGIAGFGAMAGTFNAACGAARSGVEKSRSVHAGQKPAVPPYSVEARFLDQHQYAAVATLAALIIPTDDEPGATEAGVVDYIDRITADSKQKQEVYSKGLTWLDAFCKSKYGGAFLDIGLGDQMDLLRLAFDHGGSSSFLTRVCNKLIRIWQGLTGTRINGRFLNEVRKDVADGFYTNPIAWQHVGYFGPPHPVGYLDFADPPSSTHYIDSVRMVNNTSCNTCHEIGEHPRGGFIDHTCTACHRPHAPWPYDKKAFYLEDHIGAVFSNPDRKKKELK
jgi:hypothetical protein